MLLAVTDLRRVANRILAYTVAVVGASLATVPVAHLGPFYLAGAGALGTVFLVKAVALRSRPSPRTAMALFHYSILYLALLFVLVALGGVTPR